MSADLMKRARRAAVTPARVLGRADFVDYREPARCFIVDDVRWYAPRVEQWLIRGMDERFEKYIEKYGVQEAKVETPEHNATFYSLFQGPENAFVLEEADLDEYNFPARLVKEPWLGFRTSVGVLPATPVVYLERRFGELAWCMKASRQVAVAYSASDVVGAVRPIAWRFVQTARAA